MRYISPKNTLTTQKPFLPRVGLALSALGFALAFSACSPSTPEAPAPAPTTKSEHNEKTLVPSTQSIALAGAIVGEMSTLPAIAEIKGQLALVYRSPDDRIVFKLGDNTIFLDEGMDVKGGKYFDLHVHGDNVYTFWWSHEGVKNLYFRASTDGGKSFAPTQTVNDKHGVLPPFSLLSGRDGTVGMLYHDERLPLFQAFFNRSSDHGKSWPKPDVRLDPAAKSAAHTFVLDPKMIKTNSAWLATWIDKITDNGLAVHRIMLAKSKDEGKTWSSAEEIYRGAVNLASLEAKASGANAVIVFEAHERGIHALTSSDNGATWGTLGSLPDSGSEQLNNSGLRLVIAQNTAHVVWIASPSTSPAKIMYTSIDLPTKAWGSIARLDPKEIEATFSYDPDIAVTADGVLLTSWNDYRDIVPNIYLSASFDQGKTWTTAQGLKTPGAEYVDFARFHSLSTGMLLTYQTHPNYVKPDGLNMMQMLELEPGVGFKHMPKVEPINDEARKQLLKERSEAFWKLRLTQEWDKTWDFFDYAFKVSMPKDNFVRTMGALTFHKADMREINMQGNFAKVLMNINYEVKPMPVGGKMVSMPAADHESSIEWVWIKDNWYVVYAPAVGERFLKY